MLENLSLPVINTLLNMGGVLFSVFLVGIIFKIKYDNRQRQKQLLRKLDNLLDEVELIKKGATVMQYKGCSVVYIRDANKTDPYWDADYKQVIVEYVDGTGRETAKESE